jgi:hypothetical protein
MGGYIAHGLQCCVRSKPHIRHLLPSSRKGQQPGHPHGVLCQRQREIAYTANRNISSIEGHQIKALLDRLPGRTESKYITRHSTCLF